MGRAALLLALWACGGPDPGDSGPSTPTELGPVDGFTQLVQDQGWTAGPGALVPSTMAFCCEPIVHCLDSDPGALPAAYALPPAPDQPSPDPDLYWMWGELPEGLSRDVRLRPDEALVWIGTTPPAADSFHVRTMLSARDDGEGTRERVLGALGPSLNPERLAADRGLSPTEVWLRPLVVVSAADAVVEQQVVDWLTEAGFDPATVALDRIAGTVARMGLQREADSFTTLVQVVDPVDPEALAAWWASEHHVLRLTPPSDLASAPFDRPQLPVRGTGTTEEHLSDSLEELRLALRANWPDHLKVPGPVLWEDHPTFDCIDSLSCGGSTEDRLRARSTGLTLDGGEFAVAYGAHHVHSGKASSTALSVHRTLTGTGSAWIDDGELLGTARPWLGDSHPHADALFAVVLARDCNLFTAPCLEVPSTCPGPLEGETIELVFSSWMEPGVGAAPIREELLLPRAIKFFPTVAP